MAIILQDVADSDISRSCEIERLAYKNSPLGPVLAPGPFPPDAAQQRIKEVIDTRTSDNTTHYIQAVDEETGKMIAFAEWHIYDSPASAAASYHPLGFGSEKNKEACLALYGGIQEKKIAIVGDKPHLYLHMLYTDPAFQGRGAGSMLVAWGTRRADELGLLAYLESSAAGRRLYQKHGFREVEVFKVDLSPWGGGWHEQPLMMREPASLSSS